MDLVDAAILALLCAGIGYGYVLSRRFERLRRALAEFGPALQAFSSAVDRSERSVADLRIECGKIETVAAKAPANRQAPPATPDEKEALIGSFMEIVRGRRR